jgi:predicted HicB family RNase H-like nuclease
MDQERERRKPFNVRLTKAARAIIANRAEQEGLTESEWARRALKYALGNMPVGWTGK